MCYGQVNGDAIQNFLSFFPFFFLTPFPFLGTTRLSCSVIWSLDSYLFNEWRWSLARVSLIEPFLDLSWFSSFQVPDTVCSMTCNISKEKSRGVARGSWGARDPPPPLGRPFFEQTTDNIQVAKTPWQHLGRKSHCWKAHFFKICFFVKYFRQRLLSLVNMGFHAAIIEGAAV